MYIDTYFERTRKIKFNKTNYYLNLFREYSEYRYSVIVYTLL